MPSEWILSKVNFSKLLDSVTIHTFIMHPYLIALLLITSSLGGYFEWEDNVTIDCQTDNCKIVDEPNYNRSEGRKQAGTEERKDEDNDSKPELPKKS